MRRVLIVGSLIAVGGCSGGSSNDGFTPEEWAKIQTHSPLPALPPDTTNMYADNAAAATLGQRLFFDTAFSGPVLQADDGTGNGALGAVGDRGKIACASCHEAPWMFDTRAHPNNVGLGAQFMQRNVTSVLNASYYKWKETDGVRTATWNDGLTDPEDQTSMHGSRGLIAHVIYKKYKSDYEAIFGQLDPRLDPNHPNAAQLPVDAVPRTSPVLEDPTLDMQWYANWDSMSPADQKMINRIFANFGKAIQAYLRKMSSQNSPFDKYVAGDHSQLSASAKRGLKLFIGKGGCEGCHTGPIFSDNQFHNIGIVELGPHVNPMEQGRFDGLGGAIGDEFSVDSEYSDDRNTHMLDGLMPQDSDRGKWRTKGLREVAMTPPYEHTGQLATLEDVINFDNRGGDPSGFTGTKDPLFVPLNLTPTEVADLVEFLKSLTGDPPPAALTQNTAAP